MPVGDSRDWIEAIFDTLAEEIISEDVTLQNFGTFKHITKADKKCRHPVTREVITVPAHECIKFVPSKKILDGISGQTEDDDGE